MNDAYFDPDMLVDRDPFLHDGAGAGNATEEIFRLTNLIENAGDKLEHVYNRISECRSSFVTL